MTRITIEYKIQKFLKRKALGGSGRRRTQAIRESVGDFLYDEGYQVSPPARRHGGSLP
jgi:hypothetical protein